MQNQGKALTLAQKKNIQSQDIKEIVLLLNQPPFKENVSLVGLDEMTTFDLGDLVFKIFKYLDSDININARQTQPQQIIFQVTEFLKILSYECDFNSDWENGLLNGDRKVIYPIYYFLLKNHITLKKRAYLAKFLVPLDVPEEFAGDPQLKKLNEQMKELQAQFQIVHEQFQGVQLNSLNPADLKKELTKLQQQKQQLTTKINSMKSKHGNKPEMAAMLIPTSQLRKQQQQEVRISQKIQSYRNQLENAENQLMSLQQSLTDAKKSLSPNNSPEQMLHAIRNQVKKNRDIVKERMTVEYNQRLKKLQQTQKMLAQPPITQNELMMLQNTMTAYRRAVASMQERLSKQASKDDKLAIYKGQAALVTKKKEQIQQSLKRQEDDMSRLENQIRKKEEQINKLKGAGFKKNKLQDYISELKQKKTKYAKCKAEIQQIKWQSSNLQRTYQLLKQQKERYQKQFGLVDGEKAASQVNIENATMDELNKQIDKLLDQIKKKKAQLGPKLEQKKNILSEFQKIQNQYKAKKIGFLGITSKIQDDIKEIDQRVSKLRNQVEGMDTKLQLNKLKNELIDLKTVRLNEQAENSKGNGKGCCGAKSYQEYVKIKCQEGDKQISQLTAQRQRVAQRHMPSLQQKKMFGDLKKLLLIKLQAGGGVENFQNKGQRLGNNVNVLKL